MPRVGVQFPFHAVLRYLSISQLKPFGSLRVPSELRLRVAIAASPRRQTGDSTVAWSSGARWDQFVYLRTGSEPFPYLITPSTTHHRLQSFQFSTTINQQHLQVSNDQHVRHRSPPIRLRFHLPQSQTRLDHPTQASRCRPPLSRRDDGEPDRHRPRRSIFGYHSIPLPRFTSHWVDTSHVGRHDRQQRPSRSSVTDIAYRHAPCLDLSSACCWGNTSGSHEKSGLI